MIEKLKEFLHDNADWREIQLVGGMYETVKCNMEPVENVLKHNGFKAIKDDHWVSEAKLFELLDHYGRLHDCY